MQILSLTGSLGLSSKRRPMTCKRCPKNLYSYASRICGYCTDCEALARAEEKRKKRSQMIEDNINRLVREDAQRFLHDKNRDEKRKD